MSATHLVAHIPVMSYHTEYEEQSAPSTLPFCRLQLTAPTKLFLKLQLSRCLLIFVIDFKQ